MKKLLLFLTLIGVISKAQTVSDYVSVSGNPTGIAFDNEGTLFIGTEADYAIKKYTKDGTLTTLKSDMNGQPKQLSFDSSGNLWVAFQALASIKKINPVTGVSTSYPSYAAYGITEDVTSKAIFFTENRGKLSRFDPSSGDEISILPYDLTSPRGLVFDKSGNLYIATANSNEIVKITQAGVITAVVTSIPNPTYLAIDDFQNLYISTDFKGEIYKYNLAQTNGIAQLLVSGLGYTNGLAVYNNDLYCALVSKNKVVKISLNLGTTDLNIQNCKVSQHY